MRDAISKEVGIVENLVLMEYMNNFLAF
ncbi:uncharacterized protein METZ01_LOCUS347027, partial [marine metagenome]